MGRMALLDMDGVLFDYEVQLRKDLSELASEWEKENYNLDEVSIWDLEKQHAWMKARIDLIKKQPGWWRNLPKYLPGWEVYQVAEKIGFCTEILTKGPRSKPLASSEKQECIAIHFGEDHPPVNVVGKNKSRYYGRVLVDDYPEYVAGWLEHRPRGLAIMPLHSYNKRFLHANVLHYDGQNLEEVERCLQAAYDRGSGEHWRDRL